MQNVKVEQLRMARGTPKHKPPRAERKQLTVYIAKTQMKKLDGMVKNGLFLNRSEAMREALRDLISFYGVQGSKHERKKP